MRKMRKNTISVGLVTTSSYSSSEFKGLFSFSQGSQPDISDQEKNGKIYLDDHLYETSKIERERER